MPAASHTLRLATGAGSAGARGHGPCPARWSTGAQLSAVYEQEFGIEVPPPPRAVDYGDDLPEALSSLWVTAQDSVNDEHRAYAEACGRKIGFARGIRPSTSTARRDGGTDTRIVMWHDRPDAVHGAIERFLNDLS